MRVVELKPRRLYKVFAGAILAFRTCAGGIVGVSQPPVPNRSVSHDSPVEPQSLESSSHQPIT